ncbi:MAG: AAA family ATPase [Actinomycetia bacterium]|nr:AAA family ATPase [Actinomycetes bacterium]
MSAEIDTLLSEGSVVLVMGPGGVGKTTLSAAMACRAAARHGRRVLLVTVDPARRLADALGHGLTNEPVLVPVGAGPGRLWASMVDMARGWDALVARCAPRPADETALLANPLYRTLTTRFVQSHDYIALDQLCELADGERYDLIVVDTPPSTHAIDILDAPDKMVAFFDSRLLRWLTAPYRSRVAGATAKPFLAVAERLLGGPFLASIGELFWLFSRLQPGFVARARVVADRLAAPETSYVLVSTSEPGALAEAEALASAVEHRGRRPDLVINNRALFAIGEDSLDVITDPSLRAAVEAMIETGAPFEEQWRAKHGPGPVVSVPWQAESLHTLEQLAALFD